MIELKPIATVKNNRTNPEDFTWGEFVSEIVLHDEVPEESLLGLEAFSHLEILFYFHAIPKNKSFDWARYPRDEEQWGMQGIFAQRNKNRPNKLGASFCELLEVKGKTLIVKELDAIDGTPVLDIKPVFKTFLPKTEIKEPSWVKELIEKIYW